MATAFDSGEVLLANHVRTPFSRFGGALRDVPSVELATITIREILARTGIPADRVDEVYLGVTTPSEVALDGPIPARVALLKAGLSDQCTSMTIDRACCSGLTAIQLGALAISRGTADVVLAGGTDNMGRASFLMPPSIRWGVKRSEISLKDPMASPGTDIGGTSAAYDAGAVALDHGVSREDSDQWTVRSHQRYFEALEQGRIGDEILNIQETVNGREVALDHDEEPRRDTSIEALARLSPVLGSPTVTAGNAPGQSTGASMTLLLSAKAAAEYGLETLGSIRSIGSISRNPKEIAVAPAPAILKALRPLDLGLGDVDLIEINEAFACVPLTSAKVLADGDRQLEDQILEKLNVNGGAVALGHPPGASGARILATAAKELKHRGGGRAVVSICGGLGQGDSAVVEVA